MNLLRTWRAPNPRLLFHHCHGYLVIEVTGQKGDAHSACPATGLNVPPNTSCSVEIG